MENNVLTLTEATKSRRGTSEKVIDGYLGDLPEVVRSNVMQIHKLIVDTSKKLLDTRDYSDLKNDRRIMDNLSEFLVMPKDKDEVGSIRVYKKGKKYRCMIQMTGHFTNHMEDFNQELMHEFIKNIYVTIRPTVRKKYDFTITNEGDHGNPFEGFDVFPNTKIAEDLWNKLSDRTIRTVMKESVDECEEFNETAPYKPAITIKPNKIDGTFIKLPKGAQRHLLWANETLLEEILKVMQKNKEFKTIDDNEVRDLITSMDGRVHTDGFGNFTIERDGDKFVGEVRLFAHSGKELGYVSKTLTDIWNKAVSSVSKGKVKNIVNRKDSTKKLALDEDENLSTLVLVFSEDYAKKLWDYCTNPKARSLNESTEEESFGPEYNVDMSEAQAKKTLGTLTANIIEDKKPVSQYTANIYANIITKNLLPLWAKGYRKVSITLDEHKNMNIFEFKLPGMNHDFVSRFVNGRETITGFLHRNPEIKIRMSASLFKTMKNRDDGYRFFKNAIAYYDHHAERYALKMMHEVLKMNHEMKHLVSTTKLSALVTYPMTLIFSFDNLDMSDKDCFKIHKSDITAINNFIKGIYSNYASPEKEKKKIIDDLQSMIKSFNECFEIDDNIRAISYLPEAVNTLYSGGFDDQISLAHDRFISESLDVNWPASSPDPEVKYLSEKFGVKKLKKIPRDLVAYIQIETESIKDANDKMMIASYCLSKIEIVEWYIELIEVGTKKYIVPHTKQYLETVRTQLLQCYKEIMAVKIKNPNDRPIIDIKYPAGYEG